MTEQQKLDKDLNKLDTLLVKVYQRLLDATIFAGGITDYDLIDPAHERFCQWEANLADVERAIEDVLSDYHEFAFDGDSIRTVADYERGE